MAQSWSRVRAGAGTKDSGGLQAGAALGVASLLLLLQRLLLAGFRRQVRIFLEIVFFLNLQLAGEETEAVKCQ